MTGMKIAAATMLLSGTATTALTVVEPKDLEGLGPTALLALITLAAMGTLVYFVRALAPAMRDLVKELAVTNSQYRQLASRLDQRPCLLTHTEARHAEEEEDKKE